MKNKIRNVIVCLFVSQIILSQEATSETTLNWVSSYDEALSKSKEEKKPILIYFKGSDWCGPCKVLDAELFGSERFKNLANKSLIMLEVDIPKRVDVLSAEKISENFYLKDKYKIKSFPTLLIVNHRGRVVAEKKGYVITEYYYPFIEEEIKKY